MPRGPEFLNTRMAKAALAHVCPCVRCMYAFVHGTCQHAYLRAFNHVPAHMPTHVYMRASLHMPACMCMCTSARIPIGIPRGRVKGGGGPSTVSEQPIVAVGVEQGRDGDLARVHIGRSGEGALAGRVNVEQWLSRTAASAMVRCEQRSCVQRLRARAGSADAGV